MCPYLLGNLAVVEGPGRVTNFHLTPRLGNHYPPLPSWQGSPFPPAPRPRLGSQVATPRGRMIPPINNQFGAGID